MDCVKTRQFKIWRIKEEAKKLLNEIVTTKGIGYRSDSPYWPLIKRLEEIINSNIIPVKEKEVSENPTMSLISEDSAEEERKTKEAKEAKEKREAEGNKIKGELHNYCQRLQNQSKPIESKSKVFRFLSKSTEGVLSSGLKRWQENLNPRLQLCYTQHNPKHEAILYHEDFVKVLTKLFLIVQ